MNYTVRSERSGAHWAIHIVELDGWTQAHHLHEVEYMARDWISGVTDKAPDSFDVSIEIDEALDE